MFMSFLSLQMMVNTWQRFYFFKACTKGYEVNSCLTLPLNTDIVKQWVIILPQNWNGEIFLMSSGAQPHYKSIQHWTVKVLTKWFLSPVWGERERDPH